MQTAILSFFNACWNWGGKRARHYKNRGFEGFSKFVKIEFICVRVWTGLFGNFVLQRGPGFHFLKTLGSAARSISSRGKSRNVARILSLQHTYTIRTRRITGRKICFRNFLKSCNAQESPRQTKSKKGQFMNFSQGHFGTKVQCESCLFSKGKTPEFTKMGKFMNFRFAPFFGLVCRGDSCNALHDRKLFSDFCISCNSILARMSPVKESYMTWKTIWTCVSCHVMGYMTGNIVLGSFVVKRIARMVCV